MSVNAIAKLLEASGVPGTFVDHLIHESDWSLVIKLHALFEAVLGNLIVSELKRPELSEAVSNLDFNNTKAGKVVFARALGLLDTREVAFLRGLSELRNSLVHNVHNVTFDLKEHVSLMTDAQRKKFKSGFGAALISTENGATLYAEYEESRPAFIVLSAAYSCLLVLHLRVEEQRRKMLVEALMKTSIKKDAA